MGLDLTRLESDSERASLMWDYAGDPRGLVADIMTAFAESVPMGEALPESVCGSASAVMGAAMLWEVYQRVTAAGVVTAYDYDETTAGAQIIEHAAYDHGDTFALAIRGEYGSQGPSFADSIERIEAWVTDNLSTQLAEVIDLFDHSADFAQWEA